MDFFFIVDKGGDYVKNVGCWMFDFDDVVV